MAIDADRELEEMDDINRLEKERIGRDRIDSLDAEQLKRIGQQGHINPIDAIKSVRAQTGASLRDARACVDKAVVAYRSARNKDLAVPTADEAHGVPPIEWFEEQIRLRFENITVSKAERRMLDCQFRGFRRPE